MNIRIFRRLFVLLTLMLCFGWFSFSETVTQASALCCYECPGYYEGGPGNACAIECGSSSWSGCFDSCVFRANNCYRNCVTCGGGGGENPGGPGGICYIDAHCYSGYHCEGGICVWNIQP